VHRSRRSRLLRTSAAVIALALPVSACGDDGDDEVELGEAAEDVGDAGEPSDGGTGGGEADDGDSAPGELPDCSALIPRDELGELLGLTEMQKTEEEAVDGLAFSECVWETDDVALAGVAVVESSARYDQRVELAEDEFLMEPEFVDGLGDGAVVAVGVSLETFAATGGRTATVLADGYSVEIALRLDPRTSTDDVVALAEIVLDRM
jgi:hypothetical protein